MLLFLLKIILEADIKVVLFDIEKEKKGNILRQIEFFIVIYFDRI